MTVSVHAQWKFV